MNRICISTGYRRTFHVLASKIENRTIFDQRPLLLHAKTPPTVPASYASMMLCTDVYVPALQKIFEVSLVMLRSWGSL